MIKLKSETFYYIYIDGDEVYISEDEPTRPDNSGWIHPKLHYRCTRSFYLSEPKSSGNILEFIEESKK